MATLPLEVPTKLIVSFLCALVFLSGFPPAQASARSTDVEILTDQEISELTPISSDDFAEIQHKDLNIFAAIQPENIRYLHTEDILKIYSRIEASKANWGPLRLFSAPLFQEKGKTYFANRQTLLEVDKIYNTHLVYETSGVTAGNAKPFEVFGLICGNGGEFWVLYDSPIYLKSKEYPIFGGHFSLFAINKITVSRDARNGRIVSIQEGRNSVTEPYRYLRGPFGLPVTKIEVSDSEERIYIFLGPIRHLSVAHLPIAKRP